MARFFAGCLFLFLGFNPPGPGALSPAQAAAPSGSWLEDVDLLITPRERQVFLGLQAPADREAFIQRFWQVRDPYPETPRNEARERWEERLPEARRRWHDLKDDRARVFLLNGEPAAAFESRCAGAPLEVWTYQPQFQVRYRTTLVFHTGGGPARLWRPGDAPDLAAPDLGECAADARLAEAALWIRRVGRDSYGVVLQSVTSPPQVREWVSGFRPAPAPAAARRPGARLRPARLAVDFPGRREEGLVRILVAPDDVPEQVGRILGGTRELLLTGRVLQGGRTVDSFRYRFDPLPAAAGQGAPPIAFERRLQPGRYQLEVQLDAPGAESSFVGERELAVPAPGAVPPPALAGDRRGAPAPADIAEAAPEVRGLFAEADASLAAPRPGLRLLPPAGKLVAGVQRFEARVERAAGLPDEAQIERVAFTLDGRPLLTRNRPPYEAQIDLGRTPRTHRLAAVGMTRRGEVLAHDELTLNGGGQRFTVRLLEPQAGRTYRRSLRARVQVEIPEDQSLDRVELYLGDSRAATLYQPPFSQLLVLPGAKPAGFVRAVAYLADGTSAEDLALLNGPAAADRMDIRLVELYANLLDRAGRPVEGVDPGEIRVFEDGVRQTVRQVERVEDTPLRLVTLIDNSGSMQPRLEPTRQAALQFLRRTLRPRDQAAVITFNRAPRVAVGLTGDLAALEGGLTGLRADDETSLYDSLIFSLDYLGGAAGQRAVLLFSDGLDRTSSFRFEDALESARRAGIAIYAIGIDLPKEAGSGLLARLAAETGGRSFFLQGTAGLAGACQEIERDLRSRYRISYQSSNSTRSDAFRAVRVEVGRPGLEARTISGYYP
jgi:Ca-activated chloride channel family protein